LEAGIAPKPLPNAFWPKSLAPTHLKIGSRCDRALLQSAAQVAAKLQAVVAQESCSELVKSRDTEKKIQLGPHIKPISVVTEKFRA
jgi:hypothetical protein